MSCKHDCDRSPAFPLTVENRAALPRIAYRIGDYWSLRGHMLELLNASRPLAAWTHRESDDPGIAILEGAAILGDILTFYQELYANEAFLNTATWRESIAGLVRLTGYRLAPGVGGKAVFSLLVDSEGPVVVPAGTGFKADIVGAEQTVVFESRAAVRAHPALGAFRLYRPRKPAGLLSAGLDRLELRAVGGSASPSALQSHGLAAGDRLMILPDESAAAEAGKSTLVPAEVSLVAEVEEVLDRVVLRLEGVTRIAGVPSVRAFRIGRTFRHFGHNAPATISYVDADGLAIEDTSFERDLLSATSPATGLEAYYSKLPARSMPLDSEVDDLAAGSLVVCEGYADFGSGTGKRWFAKVGRVDRLHADGLVWGGMAGAVTVLRLEEALFAGSSLSPVDADLRRFRFHEVIGPELSLGAPTKWETGAFPNGSVFFFGTYAEARTLAGRDLILQHDDGRMQPVAVATRPGELSLGQRDRKSAWMWPLTLDERPRFGRAAFDEIAPRVTAYGNLVRCTQGEAQEETVLGSGDGRESFQTFALPKSPLTYLFDSGRTPPRVPELEVHVSGVRWRRVDDLFRSVPDEPVYVVREDDEGASWVQFGDGRTGSRLPSGKDNVVAHYRAGVGAAGPLAEGATVSAVGKLPAFDEALLPGEAVGGAGPESEEGAREAAPGRTQALGRLVSIADFEAETRAMPGVVKANAHWSLAQGLPLVTVAVLTESGLEAAVEEIAASLRRADRCRGMNRFPLQVVNGVRQYVALHVTLGFAADRHAEDVRRAVLRALGSSEAEGVGGEGADGLFSVDARRFGQDCHDSQVLAAVHRVDGVTWARVNAFQGLGSPPGADPTELTVPAAVAQLRAVGCPPNGVLALHSAHLTLGLIAVETAEECS